MKFEFQGVTYDLEFKREFKDVRVGVDENGNDIVRKSTFPYTTAQLWKCVPQTIPELYRSYTVGCHFHDRKSFSLEKGRLASLKLLSRGNSLSKDLKKAMWGAYMTRTAKSKA